MPIALEYLGFERSALAAAADFLLNRWRSGGAVDLSRVIVVVPGGRAGRRLLDELVQQCEEYSLSLLPPAVETVGQLPEELYVSKQPFAGDLVQKLAWARALREADGSLVRKIVAHPPPASDALRWLELGAVLSRQHTELAADGLDFGDVAQRGENASGFREQPRWQALHAVQQAYLKLLDSLQLWDRQTARLFAIKHRECRLDKDVVLLGAVDMNRATRQMLDQVADRVTSLVLAPRQWADRFDEHGCLKPAAWKETPINLDDGRIRRVDGPAEQADCAARCLAGYAGRYRADQIAIGAPDEELVPQIARQFEQFGVACRWAAGRTLTETAPARLLSAAAEYLDGGRYPAFAALLRHPDVYDLVASGDVLSDLDAYFNEHLSARVGKRWVGKGDAVQRIKNAHAQVEKLVKPLRGARRPLADWGAAIGELLQTAYAAREFDRTSAADREVLTTCQRIHEVWRQHQSIPAELAPTVTAAEAIRLTLDALSGQNLPPPADAGAVEILGWLELSLDDAPALVVTSLNEGFVPKSVNADAFLPESLRRTLGIEDNERRYARDTYALCVLAATREELDLVVARRDAQGNPLAPSRLLFAADRKTAVNRSLEFFAAPPASALRRLPLAAGAPPLATSKFSVPRPRLLDKEIDKLRVTQFKSFLACRYRFYLEHLLRLERLEDAGEELDARGFGVLLHDVLQDFGAGASKHSTDADEIFAELRENLHSIVDARFAAERLAAVRVQLEQMLVRLRAFARWQAERTVQGWRIWHVEHDRQRLEASFDVDGATMKIIGRIDRIDFHEDSKHYAILDYKTGDAASDPEKTHRQRNEWIDLQLPLYRHLALALTDKDGVPLLKPDDIEQAVLGYIAIPKDAAATRDRLAKWTLEELQQADEAAREVVRAVRRQDFWPPAEPPPPFSEAYSAICLDSVLRSRDDAEGGEV